MLSAHSVDLLIVLPGLGAVLGAVVGLYYMIKLYLIPARPFWNHWQTASSFVGSAITLGMLLLSSLTVLAQGFHMEVRAVALILLAGLMLEAIGLAFHARTMKRQGGEGAASHFEQVTRYGFPYLLRNLLLGGSIVSLVGVALFGLPLGGAGIAITLLLALSILASAIIGRALFYVLVIPTTMPGGFFWRNKGFEEHAIETGLADKIHAGIVTGKH